MAIKFFNVGMQQANLPPVAVVAPASQRAVVGSIVRVDGRGSSDPEGTDITYRWTFTQVPIGSTLDDSSFRPLSGSWDTVTFIPDVTGAYIVRLVVNDGQFDSLPAEALLSIELVQSPTCTDIVPDGRFFFRTISDFWRLVEDREALPIVWSAYMQATAAELLEALQADYDKSIETALEKRQRRWLSYSPVLELSDAFVLFGNEQDGVQARTGSVGEPLVGFIMSASEFGVLRGTVKESSVGKTLQVLTSSGGNTGSYVIQGVGPVGKTYLVSASTPFPDLVGDFLASAADLVTTAGSDVVRSASSNFAALGAANGDIVRVLAGPDAGVYEILGVGVGAGLPDNQSLRVSFTFTDGGTRTFAAYRGLSTLIPPTSEGPLSNIVSFPSAEGSLAVLNNRVLQGQARLVGPTEVEVGEAFVFDAAVGYSLDITGGSNSGRYSIVALSTSRKGYLVSGAFTGPFPQTNIPFSLGPIGKAQGRVILVNGKAYTLLRVQEDVNQPGPPLGPGPLHLGVLDSKSLVTGLAAAEWRVPSTLVAPVDLEALGVRPGDTLVFSIQNLGNGKIADVSVAVVGVDGDRLGFVMSTSAVVPGALLELGDQEKVALAEGLGISGASINPLTGDLVLEGEALAVDAALRDIQFKRAFNNLPVTPTTILSPAGFSFQVRAERIYRNSVIPVDERTIAIPCLKEYVVPPLLAQDPSTGDLALLTRDGSRRDTSRAPVILGENADYIVDAEEEIRGTDGSTTSGSGVFTSVSGFFLSRNVEIGDTLWVGALSYSIVQVLTETELQAVSLSTGALFAVTDSALSYSITRRVTGKFIRFVPGTFSAASPAPAILRAETTFIENDQQIENNFGLMVSLTREDLSERATSSTTYREAVLGLMYAWAHGPKIHSLRLGAQILLGLPLADHRGIIRGITDDFQTHPVTGVATLGRIFIEDLDENDVPTGLSRLYFYPPLKPGDLEDYAGVETNPATGRTYQVGDVVERFAALSKGVKVLDYLTDPSWWLGRYLQGDASAEVRKYHTWALKVSADVINDEDFALVNEFGKTMDPAWTDLEGGAVLVKPLTDDITFEDDLFLNGQEVLIDDPFGNIEATAIVNDFNGNGYALHHVGAPPMSSKMLFAGMDLETPVGGAGPLRFTSARGGFITPLANPPHAGYPVFAADHGDGWVKAGDLLYIAEGANAGWYCVIQVFSDTQIDVDEVSSLSTFLPVEVPVPDLPSPDTVGVQAGEGQSFFIFRMVTEFITSGVDLDTTLGGGWVEDLNAIFVTDGVSVDDDLLIPAGPSRGRYKVVEVVGGAYPRQRLRVSPTPVAGASITYEIVRESLRGNPMVESGVATTAAGVPTVLLTRSDLDLREVRTYDDLVLVGGPDAGTYQVLDVVAPNVLYVRPAPLNGGKSTSSHINRAGLTDRKGLNLGRVAQFFPYEVAEFTIMRPRSVVHTSAVAEVSAAGSELTSGITNFGAIPVNPGDFVEVGRPVALPTDKNTGVFLIDAVVGGGFGLDVLVNLAPSVDLVHVRVLRDDVLGFTIVGDVVTAATPGFLDVGVIPGDVFEVLHGPLSGRYVVAEVANNAVLRLTTSPGNADVAGRILRIVR